MKILIFGAGPLGSLYAHLLHQAGTDVTLLARGERYDWIQEHGLVVFDEISGERASSRVKLVSSLAPDADYDLVIVLVRKNKLALIFEALRAASGVKNILFMGNNLSGFGAYNCALPAEKLLFGFPNAGGGILEQAVHFADREKPGGKPRAITIGEMDGQVSDRLLAIKAAFESATIPVDVTDDIDGWLKYHFALVGPLVGAICKHGYDCAEAAQDRETLRALVRAAREGGNVLRALGYRKRQPFQFNLFYWLPEFVLVKVVKGLLESRFAEVAFAMHAQAAGDEMRALVNDFGKLAAGTSVTTSNLDTLAKYVK